MSEEEILEKINWAIYVNEMTKSINGDNTHISVNVLQGLLDLYNKEKEKNKKLVDMAETLRKENVELLIENRQMDLHSISKDKIKAKIEELEKRLKNDNVQNINQTAYSYYLGKKEGLEEVLKGE